MFGIVADKVMHRSLKPNDVSSILTGPTLIDNFSTDRLTARYLLRNEGTSVQFRLGALWTSLAAMSRNHASRLRPSIFDNLVVMQFCAHDVTVACCSCHGGSVGSTPTGLFDCGDSELVRVELLTPTRGGSIPWRSIQTGSSPDNPPLRHSGGSCVGTGGLTVNRLVAGSIQLPPEQRGFEVRQFRSPTANDTWAFEAGNDRRFDCHPGRSASFPNTEAATAGRCTWL